MRFIIMPLSYRKKEEKEEKIRETVTLATQIRDRSQQLFTLAGILAFTDKLIDEETANKIRRMIEMTKVARIFEEEKLQALAKAEEEKKLALAKAEEEKRLALAKAEKSLLAKAEEENKLNLAREKRECVLKMIRKSYSSEEIASIVSGFTLDEIDVMRREMGAV